MGTNSVGTTKVSQLETRCAADDDAGMMLASPCSLSLLSHYANFLVMGKGGGGCLGTSLKDQGCFSVNFIEFSLAKMGQS